MTKPQKIEGGKNNAFNNLAHNKIHLTFPNGNAISTIWGYGSYSENQDDSSGDNYGFSDFKQSDTVEIMILNAPDKLLNKIKRKYDFEDGSVKGYLTMTEWLEIIKMLSK